MQRITQLPRRLSRRAFSISARHHASPFGSSPAPPRLPKDEQEIFERLQRQSTGAFSTPRTPDTTTPSETLDIRARVDQSPSTTTTTTTFSSSSRPQINQSPDSDSNSTSNAEIRFENGKEIKKGEDLHPNMRRGAPPEFEGEVNPKTGEVGGPKNEPLRWGGRGDWSYNGRVTDF